MTKAEFYQNLIDLTVKTYNQTFQIVTDFFGEDRVEVYHYGEEALRVGLEGLFNEYGALDSLIPSSLFTLHTDEEVFEGKTLLDMDDSIAASSIYQRLLEYYCEFQTIVNGEDCWVTRDYVNLNTLRASIGTYLLPAYTVTIYYPEVTITNEFDSSHTIKDLYCKARIIGGDLNSASGWLYMKRTTYTAEELNSHYLHSHAEPTSPDTISAWKKCCFGSGPLASLAGSTSFFSSAEEVVFKWCNLVDQYVTVESVAGRPYIKLETIGKTSNRTTGRVFTNYLSSDNVSIRPVLSDVCDILRPFIKFFVRSKYLNMIEFDKEVLYSIKTEFKNAIAITTAAFSDWLNSTDYNNEEKDAIVGRITKKVVLNASEEGFSELDTSYTRAYLSYEEGTEIIVFKGEHKHLHIIPLSSQENSEGIIILNPYIVERIIMSVTNFRNYATVIYTTERDDALTNFRSSRFYTINRQ